MQPPAQIKNNGGQPDGNGDAHASIHYLPGGTKYVNHNVPVQTAGANVSPDSNKDANGPCSVTHGPGQDALVDARDDSDADDLFASTDSE